MKTLFLLIYLIRYQRLKSSKLSFGVKATTNLFDLDVTRLNPPWMTILVYGL
jgi:hypothetical protein